MYPALHPFHPAPPKHLIQEPGTPPAALSCDPSFLRVPQRVVIYLGQGIRACKSSRVWGGVCVGGAWRGRAHSSLPTLPVRSHARRLEGFVSLDLDRGAEAGTEDALGQACPTRGELGTRRGDGGGEAALAAPSSTCLPTLVLAGGGGADLSFIPSANVYSAPAVPLVGG